MKNKRESGPNENWWKFREARRRKLQGIHEGENKSSVKRIQGMWKRWSLLHEFRSENGASLRRITPSTQVGRLSGHTLTLVSVNSIPKWKKGEGTARRKVQALVGVLTKFLT